MTHGALDIGTIGLNNAGKTVFHAILYGFRNDFPNTTFSFPDDATVGYLNPIWTALDNGRLPDATAQGRPDFLVWDVRLRAADYTEYRYRVRTADYAGRLVRRGQADDIKKLAQDSGLNGFIDECDGLLFLIDVTDDTQVSSQLDTLEYILDRIEKVMSKHGSAVRPLTVVFTKCDAILENLGVSIEDAREELAQWMDGHPRWRQLSKFLRNRLTDGRYASTFPVSCFGYQCDPGQAPRPQSIEPKWVHEPLLWALPRAGALAQTATRRVAAERDATERREYNAKVAKLAAMIGLPILFVLVVFLIIQGLGHSSVMKKHREVAEWCDANAGPDSAPERVNKRVAFLTENKGWYTRRILLSKKFLTGERDKCEADRASAQEWWQADQTAYDAMRKLTPVTTWYGFAAAKAAATRYLFTDKGKVAGVMAPQTRDMYNRMTAVSKTADGLNVWVSSVSGAGSELVDVWVAHTDSLDEVSVARKLQLNTTYYGSNRRLLELYIKEADSLPIHVTVKPTYLSASAAVSKRLTFADAVFLPNQQISVSVGAYTVYLQVDCPRLQNLALPEYQQQTLPPLPE